jgi:hypothetical protein
MVPNERMPLFIEMFCITFDIDYTNMSIIMSQYLNTIKPSIKDVALMARDLGITVRRFPINENYGYTLIRNNRDVELTQKIFNEDLAKTIVLFNRKYLKMSEGHHKFLKEIYYDPS